MLDTEDTHLQKMEIVLGELVYQGDRHVVTPSGALGKRVISRSSGEGWGRQRWRRASDAGWAWN